MRACHSVISFETVPAHCLQLVKPEVNHYRDVRWHRYAAQCRRLKPILRRRLQCVFIEAVADRNYDA